MSVLYILCGIPGSGKSTWARKQVENYGTDKMAWISRDKIRFNLVKPDEEYFSRENEVISIFVDEIQKAIDNGTPFVLADATHLNRKSRLQLLNQLVLNNTSVRYVYFDVPLSVALERNSKRQGRERVPDSVIEKMYYSFSKPAANTIVIDENGNEKIMEETG